MANGAARQRERSGIQQVEMLTRLRYTGIEARRKPW